MLENEDKYVVEELLTGLDPAAIFYRITCTSNSGEAFAGYVERIEAQPLDEPLADIAMNSPGETMPLAEDFGEKGHEPK